MALKKAHEVDAYINKPDTKYRAILIYGPDTGLVSERANFLAKNTGVDLKDSFATIRLNADDVAEDRSRLADEAFTIGMFGGERLIRVSGTTRRNLAEAVKPVLATEISDCWIIIEAADLQKSSGLRTAFEKSKFGIALPCYQDDAKALDQLINDEITKNGLKIDRETITYLKSYLGGDRLASRNELQKLALFCYGQEAVTIDDINQIVGDASQFDANDIIDAVAAGNMKVLQQNIGRTIEAGISPDMLLIFTLRYFQLLYDLRSKMEQQRANAMTIVSSARPPIFYARKNVVASALSKWKMPMIERALVRLDNAAFEARANQALASSIAGTNLLALTIEAQRAS